MTNPFRGLLPFEEEHAAFFFGRDHEIHEITQRLEYRRLIAVTGVSGSGKSSLVMAGVIPMLKAGLVPRLGTVHVAKLKPRDGPIVELRRRLSATLNREISEEALNRTTFGLVDAVKPLPPNESLLILVDQFEEIFPYRKGGPSESRAVEADRFVTLLLRATEQQEISIYIMLTMRSDFLGACAIFRGLPEALNDGHYLVPRMTRHQLQEAIESPLELAGARMDPGLVQTLLNDCAEEPDHLPVLQHLLKRMFERAEVTSAVDTFKERTVNSSRESRNNFLSI